MKKGKEKKKNLKKRYRIESPGWARKGEFTIVQ